MSRHKTSRVIKPYRVTFMGWDLTVKEGCVVSNSTACGHDDDYRFIGGNPKGHIELHTEGFDSDEVPLTLQQDLTYYGLNIPAEYCKPYEED